MNKKKGVLFKYIKHDIKNGIGSQWKKYVAAGVIFSFLCGVVYRAVWASGQHPGSIPLPAPTMGDYLFQLLQGSSRPYSQDFDVNVLWLLVNLFLGYIVSFYPFKDLHGYGQLMLIRSQKRNSWWFGKCVWNVGCVTLYYAVLWLVAGVFALLTGSLSLVPTAEIQAAVTRGSVEGLTPVSLVFHALLAPWLASLAISMLQMTVSLFTQPIIGVLTVCAVLVVSIFTDSFLAPGNYLMMMRHGLSIPWAAGCLWLVFLVAAAVLAGYFGFKKRDIFSA